MEHLIMDHVMSWYFGTSLALMGLSRDYNIYDSCNQKRVPDGARRHTIFGTQKRFFAGCCDILERINAPARAIACRPAATC